MNKEYPKGLEPLEAVKDNFRKPVRPTRARMLKAPFALIILAWAPDVFGEAFDTPADRDMEVFKELRHAEQHLEILTAWAQQDIASHGDLRHAFIIFDSTNPDALHIHKMDVQGGSAEWRTSVRDGFHATPQAIFAMAQRDRIAADAKVNDGAKPKKGVRRVAKAEKQPVRRIKKRKVNSAAPVKQGRIQPRIKKEVAK